MKKYGSDYKLLTGLFYRLLPYQILLIVINAVNGIVDSLYASNVIGQDAMSAIGLFGPLNHFLYAAGMMLVSGSQILYGRYLAADRSRIHSVFSVNLLLSLFISLLTAVLLAVSALTGATRMMVNEETNEQVLTMFNRYILGQAPGIPALILGQQLFAFLSLENQIKRTMAASLICFATNAVLNHVFVYILKWDTFGLGLSSALASWIFLGVQAVYYLRGRSEWKFSLRGCRWKDAPEIMRLGYSGALSRFVEMFRCLIVNFLILRHVGAAGISAFAASNSLLAVIWAVPFGITAVARMLFSVSIGEKDRRSLVDTMHITLTRGILIISVIDALLILLADPLTRLFYQNPADPVFDMTVMGFRLLPLCMPLSIVSLTFASYAQTIQKKLLSILLPIVDGAVGVTVLGFFLIPAMKMNGLYIANILNGVICFLLILILAWAEQKRFPRNLESLMAIPASFGAAPEDRMDLTVRSLDEVLHISEGIADFALQRGIDRRKAVFSGLCMEEMAGNVVLHGFTKDSKEHSVDLRVVRHGDEMILRIRDNCMAFNPADREKSFKLDKEGHNIGIHLVYRLAKEVYYQNLLGLNVLTIRL